MPDLDEPLALSAPLALEYAPKGCAHDPLIGGNCAWSHGFWQVLRLMGLANGPAQFRDFFDAAFGGVSVAGAPRVLISGSADYSMLACTLAAFRGRGIEPDVTLIDRCDTPVWLNRWYAERQGCALQTQRCDVLDYRPEQPFDVICTHAFLGYFSPPQRPMLARKWHDLLRPGGRLVTVNRVQPNAAEELKNFSAEQAASFLASVRGAASTLPASIGISATELDRLAETYAGKARFWPVRSTDELRQMFEGAGLRIDRMDMVDGPRPPAAAKGAGGPAGPTVPGNGSFATIIATRP